MITATAPGRCGLVGNPTDMYGGSVISCSTRERATCTIDQDVDTITIEVSGDYQAIDSAEDLVLRDGDKLNITRAVLSALEILPGHSRPFRLSASTDIPMQAGLAGSTSHMATVVGALLAHLEISLNLYEIAELVRKIEYDIMKVVCGFQDHYMATFGGLNYMDFRERDSSELTDAMTPFATIEPLAGMVNDLPIILAHTGTAHNSGVVHRPIRDRWLAGDEDVVDGQLEIARFARAGKKALLARDWHSLGDLMNRNHAIQRSLGGSGESNERLIAAALEGGALGAKLAGAGGGGTILALTLDPERTIKSLLAANADQILTPEPSPGLTVEVRV